MAEHFIGILSGTSMDGIDAALVRFGPGPSLVASHTLKFPPDLRADLLALAVPGANEIDRLGAADVRLGRLFAQAVNELLARAQVAPAQVRAIGSHGQTIRHRAGGAAPFTLQIGDPNVIAALTGIPVAADFRRKDLALGGQGAPLVPAFHAAVFRQNGQDRVIVNIGGIANITVLPGDAARPVLGYDTGPGNTLLDGWSRRILHEPMDRDGAFAASGRVHGGLLAALLADPYFSQPPPKSTGPEYFSADWLRRHLDQAGPLAPADVQASLLALTARGIADSIRQLPGLARPEVFVCGGGARNAALMGALRENLPGSAVAATDTLGVPGDWVEAMAFAWLARQRVTEGAGNCPLVTGAARPAVLGGLWLPG
ncbi:MAG: anhydro-N-acetylmuramic acid kinase [Opitutae bacterium]|nr:anhydro-N-acetylmuramic acid kinase [Opitutae bacterium]